MATLAKLLQVEMGLPEMAERLAAAGRGKDSILAHINPREAKLLKAHGGSGKKNPRTGIVEFDDYNEDPNAGESQARDNITSTPLESSPTPQGSDLTSTQPPAVTPAQDQTTAETQRLNRYPAPAPAAAAPIYDFEQPAGAQMQAAATSSAPSSNSGYVTKFPNEFVASGTSPGSIGAQFSAQGGQLSSDAAAAQSGTISSNALPTDSVTEAAYTPPGLTPQNPRTAGSAPGSQKAAAVGGGVAPGGLIAATQPQPGLAQQIGQGAKKLGSYLKGINTSLEPSVPYLKSGLGLYQAYQGSQAAKQAQEQAQKTENELRGQAAQYRSQGQKLVELGQAGGLTAPQQQALEVQRAVAAQRMASSGVTGGTAQAQIEADLSRQAANFAQQNIDQGNKLLQIADADVLKAINTGYAQDQDAQKLARDMYQNVFSNLFGGTGNTGSPGQQKITDETEESTNG